MCELGPSSPFVRQPAHAVLDHDHARIDDETEIDRAQAHQAGRDAGGQHHVGREKHGERDRQRHDQPAAEVAQHGQENHDHESPAGHQVVQHRAQGLVDQVGAVVERLDRHARRQALLKLGDLVLHPVHDLPPVLADEHHHQARDDLSLAVACRQPRADHGSGVDLGDVADRDGHAVAFIDHDGRDVLDRLRLAHAPDVPRLALMDQVTATDVGIVVLECIEHIGHRQPSGRQLVRVHLHLVCLELASVGVDLGHAGNLAQLVGDEPVQQRAQVPWATCPNLGLP